MTHLAKLLPLMGAFTAPALMLMNQMKRATAAPSVHWTEYLHDCRDGEK